MPEELLNIHQAAEFLTEKFRERGSNYIVTELTLANHLYRSHKLTAEHTDTGLLRFRKSSLLEFMPHLGKRGRPSRRSKP